MYKRIDQPTLTKLNMKPKQVLCEEAITSVHSFFMLQRFRQNRDLTGFDKTKPLPVADDDSDSDYDSDKEETENVNK